MASLREIETIARIEEEYAIHVEGGVDIVSLDALVENLCDELENHDDDERPPVRPEIVLNELQARRVLSGLCSR